MADYRAGIVLWYYFQEPMEVVFSSDSNNREGDLLAIQQDLSKLLKLSGVKAQFVITDLKLAGPDDRFSTYTCTHCQAASLKTAWGPGRITCPACHKIVPAASEQSQPSV